MSGRTVLIVLLLLLVSPARPASASDHPSIARTDPRCSSCHVDKLRGRSVHSAMALSCTVCHWVNAQAGSTTITLAVPKEKICFGCHEQATEAQQHVPKVKGQCVDCHDSHSSKRRMLLRARPR